MKNKTLHNNKSIPLLALVAATAIVLSAAPARAQFTETITPDQFQFQTWGGNLYYSTEEAYPGDTSLGYGYTEIYAASPSATINIPLGENLPAGWHLYTISEWIPFASSVYSVINVINDNISYGTSSVPGEPWAGENGSQQQWLDVNSGTTNSMVELGPGPQSDRSLGGSEVWIDGRKGSTAPALEVHYLGSFQDMLQTFDAVSITEVVFTLNIAANDGNAVLSWTSTGPNLVLQSTSSLNPANWMQVTNTPVVVGTNYVVTTPLSGTAEFYRLEGD